MPYPNFHAARVHDPDNYERFATKGLSDGVTAIIGFKKEGGSEVQAYRFAKDKFTAAEARAWLKDHDITGYSFEEARDTNEVMEDMKEARGQGQGVGGEKQQDGGADFCINGDGEIKPHQRGMSCVAQYGEGWRGATKEEVEKAKMKNEMDEDELKALNESLPMNETAMVSFMLEKKDEAGDESMDNYLGRVQVAQEAISQNGNRREYPISVLKEAIADVQIRMQNHGPLLMETQHPRDGNQASDLRETTALIKEVEWNNDGTVTLNGIQFINTQAGKDMFELAKALSKSGARLGVSQRAVGKSHYVKNEDTGKVKEVVDWLRIKKWDFTPPGEQSVKKAQFELQKLMEDQQMEEKRILTEDEVKSLFEAQQAKFDEMIQALKDELKPAEPEPEPESKEPAENDALLELQKKLNEQTAQVERLTRKEQLETLKEVGTKLINEELAKEDYKRFSDPQKKVLSEEVSYEDVYGKADITKPDSVKQVILESLQSKISSLDKLLAAAKLKETGYPDRGTGEGLTRVEIVNENIPGMERIKQIEAAVEKAIDPYQKYWKMPDDHPGQQVVNEIMERYYKANYEQLLNEANEEFTQSDIGVKVATINAVVIPVALRRLTAMKFCNTVTMKSLLDYVMIESYNPSIENDIHTNLALFQPTENGTLQMVGSAFTGYPIIATEKGFRTNVSAKAIATAKNTSMDPVISSVASMAKLGAQITDQFIYEWAIARAQAYSYTDVSTYETLTQVGATAEYQAANQGWVKYEVYKHYDSNGNPDDAKLLNLFGTVSGNTIQEVVVGYGATPTLLTYSTHYTVNWADGSVTLTAAGVTAVGSDDVKAKYAYTSNAKFWSVTGGGTTVTLYDWLLNLQQMIGQAKVLIRNRFHDPDFAVAGITVEDLISKGPQFTSSGAQQGTIKDAMGTTLTYDGLPLDRSGWAPSCWVIVGVKGGTIYGIHTPLMVTGPVEDTTTTGKFYKYNGFAAVDVPQPEQFALVGITDLASL